MRATVVITLEMKRTLREALLKVDWFIVGVLLVCCVLAYICYRNAFST